ncbi:glycosyltransferase family 2 protein [Entomomonas asaccharolytica]|uniref:Glycosyltransferase family 2 protein n=1 Tax=Entomomonas asaccharolytica TaxID=2785331 RepID=A0A974RXC2_9GAMM|nr:glycosyltransferase family 2 protein [Entomomonas asaccharolytica]QQP84694.1 glycosyltransferase family 2 protein [Entomomonas asaccharolytica]
MSSNHNNLLSICCLGYNHAKFLQENLKSISNIDYKNIEVIVVDDGSQDNSIEILNQLKKSLPYKLEIIDQKNTGNIGKNFNNALKVASGEFITFIALDDVFNSKVVLLEVNEMIANPKLAFIASSKAIYIDDQGMIEDDRLELSLHIENNPSIRDLLELEYSKFGSFYIQGSIFRKNIIDTIGGFDEDMTGDDIVLRTKVFNFMLNNTDLDFKIIKENNVFYRMHSNNIHKNSARQIKIVTEYLERYWPDRPNPPILIDWMKYAISKCKFEEYLPVFAFNKRAASLLNDEEIQDKIRTSIIKSREIFFQKVIFNKQKIDSTKSQVTLFGFIKFSYSRKKNKKPNNKKIHYSQYN